MGRSPVFERLLVSGCRVSRRQHSEESLGATWSLVELNPGEPTAAEILRIGYRVRPLGRLTGRPHPATHRATVAPSPLMFTPGGL